MAEMWSREDPLAALEFMNARAASEKPEMAKRAVAFMWLKKDPAAAQPFLREAVDRDPAMYPVLLPLVQYMMINDLPSAMALALRVPDKRERESLLKQGLMRWVQRDSAATEAFMAAHPVSKNVEAAVQGAKRMRGSRAEASAAQ
jgi:hypothetical protein